ncbi:aldo/keto reductase [Saccharibacillus alkalitolerans]|uniref:Aldo/keto reductase n=1 Tax=Saccharibacillus alkalitolerans TaxID=2705290 RepID=A0ABX0F985_9BACL|nr:aldo/keto reductase [Saccharibacillus alkalitolerans]NGZ76113.1 aldo/keto reductase [Saccharibacillus alkalitolerans]
MKLALGTAQLGMTYGIANQTGMPNANEAYKILEYALDHGVSAWDTAPVYGESERRIGDFLKSSNRQARVLTKLPPLSSELEVDSLYDRLRHSIRESQSKLGVSSLDSCLLHSPSNLFSHNGKVVEALIELKKAGEIKRVGVSTYTPDEAKAFLNIEGLDVIQLPINIMDQRLERQGILNQLTQKNVTIYARSTYLQGLLLMNLDSLPERMHHFSPYLVEFIQLAKEFNLTQAELALLYIRDFYRVDYLIVGCESLEQLKENIRIINLPALPKDIKEKAEKLFFSVPESILNPSKWEVSK